MKTTYKGQELWPAGTLVQLSDSGLKYYNSWWGEVFRSDKDSYPTQVVKVLSNITIDSESRNVCAVFRNGKDFGSGWMPATKSHWNIILGLDEDIFEDAT